MFYLSFLLFAPISASAGTVTINCRSTTQMDGYNGAATHDYLYFSAIVRSNERLSEAKLSGAYTADTSDGDKARDIFADPNYQPQSPIFNGMNRFQSLEDPWSWFAPLLPKSMLGSRSALAGYIQIFKESGFKGNVRMSCLLNTF